MNRGTSITVLAAILTLGIAGGVGLQKALGVRPGAPAQDRIEATPAAKQMQESFNRVAEFATKSVVHITTQARPQPEDFFPQAQQNVGSGVIVSDQGHILTNSHVVRDARGLFVRSADGREFRGDVVGDDPDSDLALVKIDAAGVKLQPLPFADSDRVRVGDWVLAIGSPFGYNHSVSAGIVSAKHRRTQMNLPYQDYIQTDAAINPGNSGGALVNLNGELVGVNAAIVSQNRSFEGIGLAISANLATWVKDRLQKDGRVRRGYLGVHPVEINQQLVDALRQDGIRSLEDLLSDLGLETPRGVFIVDVPEGGPAARAGVRRGDVLVELDGKAISHLQDLFFRVAEAEPGRKAKVKLMRDRKLRELEVEVAERPAGPRRK